VSEETKERLVHVVAFVIEPRLAHLGAERSPGEPGKRGVADDAKEALLKTGASATSGLSGRPTKG